LSEERHVSANRSALAFVIGGDDGALTFIDDGLNY